MKKPMKLVSLLTAAAIAMTGFVMVANPITAKADGTYTVGIDPSEFTFDNSNNKTKQFKVSLKNSSGNEVEVATTGSGWFDYVIKGANSAAFTMTGDFEYGVNPMEAQDGTTWYVGESASKAVTISVSNKASELLKASGKDSITATLTCEVPLGESDNPEKTIILTYTEKTSPAIGDEVKAKDATYKVTAEGTVEYVAPADAAAKTVNVPDEMTDETGKSYKVTSVAPNALKGNKKVTKVKFGKNVTKIGASACDGCTKLGTVEMNGDTVKTIDKNAFRKIKKNAKFKISAKKLKTAEKLIKNVNKKGGAKTAILKYKKAKTSKKSKK